MQLVEFSLIGNTPLQALAYGKCTVTLAATPAGSGAAATLYNQSGTVLATNTVTADASGLVSFQALNGTYDYTIRSADGTYSVILPRQQIFDLAAVANALAAGTVAGMVSKIYSTQGGLFADLAAAANTLGLVYADPTASNNDLYVKVGASGSGSWTGPLGFSANSTVLQGYVNQAAASAASVSGIARTGTADSSRLIEFVGKLGEVFAYFATSMTFCVVKLASTLGITLGSNGEGLSAYTDPDVIAAFTDQNGNAYAEIGLNGVKTNALTATTLNDTPVSTIAQLLGQPQLSFDNTTKMLAMAYGQSLSNGTNATSSPTANDAPQVLTTDQPYGNLMFEGGVRFWEASDGGLLSIMPHVETTNATGPHGETIMGGFQAMLFQLLNAYGIAPGSAPFNTLAFGCGVDGATIAQLASGTTPYARISSALAAANSLLPSDVLRMPGWFWLQGESDQTTSGYVSALETLAGNVDATVRAALSHQTDPVVCFTYQADLPAMAQHYVDAAAGSKLIRIIGPMYPIQYAGLVGAQTDYVHRGAHGYRHFGAICAVAWFTHFILKRPWRPLQLSFDARGKLRCRVNGSDLILKYDVPHGGCLAIDDQNWAQDWAMAQRGFYLFNSVGTEKPVKDVIVESRNEVRLVGASAAAGDLLRVGYKDPTNTSTSVELVCGVNLRDCQGDVLTFDDGGGIRLDNWALCQEHTLTSAELA